MPTWRCWWLLLRVLKVHKTVCLHGETRWNCFSSGAFSELRIAVLLYLYSRGDLWPLILSCIEFIPFTLKVRYFRFEVIIVIELSGLLVADRWIVQNAHNCSLRLRFRFIPLAVFLCFAIGIFLTVYGGFLVKYCIKVLLVSFLLRCPLAKRNLEVT